MYVHVCNWAGDIRQSPWHWGPCTLAQLCHAQEREAIRIRACVCLYGALVWNEGTEKGQQSASLSKHLEKGFPFLTCEIGCFYGKIRTRSLPDFKMLLLHGAGVTPVWGIVSHIPDHAEYLLLIGNKGTVQKGALNKTSPGATKTTLWKWLFTVPAPFFHSLHCERKQTHP